MRRALLLSHIAFSACLLLALALLSPHLQSAEWLTELRASLGPVSEATEVAAPAVPPFGAFGAAQKSLTAPSGREATARERQVYTFEFSGPQRNERYRRFQSIDEKYRLGNFDAALLAAVEYLQHWPSDQAMRKLTANISGLIGIEHYNQQRHTEALPYLASALELDPDYTEVYVALGYAHLQLKDTSAAEEVLTRGAARFPTNGRIAFGLGEVANARHDLRTALHYYTLADQEAPGTSYIQEKLERVRREVQATGGHHLISVGTVLLSYDPALPKQTVAAASVMLEEAQRELDAAFGISHQEPVTVVLSSGEAFRATANAPHWASGIYDGKVRIPVSPDLPKEHLRRYLWHELTHAYVAVASGSRCPTWLNEGLAQYFEGERISARRHELFLTAARGRYLAPFAELEQAFVSIGEADLARLAYDQSLAGWQYLAENGRTDSLQRLMAELKRGRSMDQALQAVYRFDTSTLRERVSARFGR